METDICTQCGEPYFLQHLDSDGVCITCNANKERETQCTHDWYWVNDLEEEMKCKHCYEKQR